MKTRSAFIMLASVFLLLVLTGCQVIMSMVPTFTPYPTYTSYPTYTPFAAPSEVVTELPTAAPTAAPTDLAYANTSGLSMGNAQAKVKVVEFADFQCPYCQQFFLDLEPTIINKYVETNLIYYTFSPMAFLGQESVDAAEAAYCANDQGKFWEYRATLFNNLGGENSGSYSRGKLILFANNLKLDATIFKTCLVAGQHQGDIDAAATYAQNHGVNSTPSFLVNNKVVDASGLQQAIEDALK